MAKMKLYDIVDTRQSKAVVRVLHPKKSDDPTADLYRKIRDLGMYDETVPVGLRIAILEMVKMEMINGLQAQIDEG